MFEEDEKRPKLIAWKTEKTGEGDDTYRVYLTTEYDKANIAMRHSYIDYSLSGGLVDYGGTIENPRYESEESNDLPALIIANSAIINAMRDLNTRIISDYDVLKFAVLMSCRVTEKLASETPHAEMMILAANAIESLKEESDIPAQELDINVGYTDDGGVFNIYIGGRATKYKRDRANMFRVTYSPKKDLSMSIPASDDVYSESDYRFGFVASSMILMRLLPREKPGTFEDFQKETSKFLGWFGEQINSGSENLDVLYKGAVRMHAKEGKPMPSPRFLPGNVDGVYITVPDFPGREGYYVVFTPTKPDFQNGKPDVYIAFHLMPDGLGSDTHAGEKWLSEDKRVAEIFGYLGQNLESLGCYPASYDEFGDIVSAVMQNYTPSDGSTPVVSVLKEGERK